MNTKIVWVDLAGVKYPMVGSMRATKEITRRFGSMKEAADRLTDYENAVNQLDAMNDVLKSLIDAGIKYCRLINEDCPETLDFEPEEAIMQNELTVYADKIREALAAGNKTTVKAAPPKNAKNAETTPGV